MQKAEDDGRRRPETRLALYAEKWIFGSTRSELDHDERAIFTDFLCIAAMNGGIIEVYCREQTARQLNCELELLNRFIDNSLKTGKIKREYKKREKKEIFYFTKWEQFQPSYLWSNPGRMGGKKRSAKNTKNDAHDGDIRKGKENKEKENKGDENEATSPGNPSSNSPLPSLPSPKTSPTKKEEFLAMLKACKDYPYNEVEDSLLFDITFTQYPNINILEQTGKKIKWWEKNTWALEEKSDPRGKLKKWFEEEAKFKNRGGPQQVGEVMQNMDKDKARFLGEIFKKK